MTLFFVYRYNYIFKDVLYNPYFLQSLYTRRHAVSYQIRYTIHCDPITYSRTVGTGGRLPHISVMIEILL